MRAKSSIGYKLFMTFAIILLVIIFFVVLICLILDPDINIDLNFLSRKSRPPDTPLYCINYEDIGKLQEDFSEYYFFEPQATLKERFAYMQNPAVQINMMLSDDEETNKSDPSGYKYSKYYIYYYEEDGEEIPGLHSEFYNPIADMNVAKTVIYRDDNMRLNAELPGYCGDFDFDGIACYIYSDYDGSVSDYIEYRFMLDDGVCYGIIFDWGNKSEDWHNDRSITDDFAKKIIATRHKGAN